MFIKCYRPPKITTEHSLHQSFFLFLFFLAAILHLAIDKLLARLFIRRVGYILGSISPENQLSVYNMQVMLAYMHMHVKRLSFKSSSLH